MRLKLLGVVAALGIAGSVLSNTSSARADAYLVDATFQPTSNYPSNFPATVSGTIDIRRLHYERKSCGSRRCIAFYIFEYFFFSADVRLCF